MIDISSYLCKHINIMNAEKGIPSSDERYGDEPFKTAKDGLPKLTLKERRAFGRISVADVTRIDEAEPAVETKPTETPESTP